MSLLTGFAISIIEWMARHKFMPNYCYTQR